MSGSNLTDAVTAMQERLAASFKDARAKCLGVLRGGLPAALREIDERIASAAKAATDNFVTRLRKGEATDG